MSCRHRGFPCPLGCARYLSSVNGHNRCLQCLGIQHAEAAFVVDSCLYCGHMSVASLWSRLSLLKGNGVEPSLSARPGFPVTSRGLAARALGDLRITVRASLSGPSPRTSVPCGSRVISLAWLVTVPAFHSVCHRRIGRRSQHRGMGYHPPRMKIRQGCLLRCCGRRRIGPGADSHACPCSRKHQAGGEHTAQSPWLDDWFLGAAHNCVLRWYLSSRRCMRSWQSRGWPLFRPEATRLPPPSSLPSMAGQLGGTLTVPRWRERRHLEETSSSPVQSL